MSLHLIRSLYSSWLTLFRLNVDSVENPMLTYCHASVAASIAAVNLRSHLPALLLTGVCSRWARARMRCQLLALIPPTRRLVIRLPQNLRTPTISAQTAAIISFSPLPSSGVDALSAVGTASSFVCFFAYPPSSLETSPLVYLSQIENHASPPPRYLSLSVLRL